MMCKVPRLPRPASTTSTTQPRAAERGYVLLFALGLLAVMATLIMSITVSMRIDAQLMAREKEALQEEYLLQGAAQFVAMQLGITTAVDALKLPPNDEVLSRWNLWRPTAPLPPLALDGRDIVVDMEDISGLPDANTLTPEEWERLFILVGAGSAEQAKQLAARVIALKEDISRTRATPGFTSLREITEWSVIPSAMVRAFPGGDRPDLSRLLTVGTKNKRIDINNTPLPLLKALGNVSDDQLQRLATLRRAGPLNASQAEAWIQGTGLSAHPPGAPPMALRVRLQVASPSGRGLALLTTIASENAGYAVVDQMIDKR